MRKLFGILASFSVLALFSFTLLDGCWKKSEPIDHNPHGCKTVDITQVPGYSPRNRYFHEDDFRNSFLMSPNIFGIYQFGGPDSYQWDSIQKCSDIYKFYFTNDGRQERINPNPAQLEIHEHHIKVLTQMGIFLGDYDLVFDFNDNQRTLQVPNEDVGKWLVSNGGSPVWLIIRHDRQLSFGLAVDSMNLPRYRINQVWIDHTDHSALYDVTPIDGNADNVNQFLIKHGPSQTLLLHGPDNNIEHAFAQLMSKQ